ncbi:NAD-dependent epimerase/dehydratase family protein [Cryobacterium sp. TMT1-19]|uniref:NAD-dependent epimerase/dehydratase family protein n=1 Tax=Cryobacterium sp. TMT1-19 TaxID=1259231 RepID=UPI00106A7DDF|nr:NAD-dependent epimerase/dehydratase family protein [Cryobacterium sp. TMT1-19]TFD39227.1 NAD-dependent epimerase/dehydratase family protein [Cryobacterium sp. TMT1-19]
MRTRFPSPGEYGTSKLLMEAVLVGLSIATGIPVMIGRIANLHGPGQSLAKQQGIVSQVCKTSLLGQPISMFVSLDTRRDYIIVDDCAALIAQAGARLRRVDRGSPVMKILASGRSVTLASIRGEFRRLIGRRPRVVTGVSPYARLQGRDLRFLSRVWPDLDRAQKTPLVVGMSRTLADLSLQVNGARSSAMN